jgi:hypothetical protein
LSRQSGVISTDKSNKAMQLVRPGPEHLSSYVGALERGWSADNERGAEAGREELCRIKADALAFLGSMEDLEGKGLPVILPDGSAAQRLPGFRRWLWDGEFCGSMGFRWQPGTTALPPYRPTVLVTSVMRSYLGNKDSATQNARSASCFWRSGQLAFPMSKSQPIWTTLHLNT